MRELMEQEQQFCGCWLMLAGRVALLLFLFLSDCCVGTLCVPSSHARWKSCVGGQGSIQSLSSSS